MVDEYLYSWGMGRGFKQTIRDGQVVNVIEIPALEAQEKYYATRSPKDVLNDIRKEEDAKETIRYLKMKDEEEKLNKLRNNL
jgi:hypothetical protein